MALEPTFDLSNDAEVCLRDEMNVPAEHRLPASHACIFGETRRKLIVDARIARTWRTWRSTPRCRWRAAPERSSPSGTGPAETS